MEEEKKQGGQVDFEEYHEQYLDRMLGRYNKESGRVGKAFSNMEFPIVLFLACPPK